MGVKVKKIDDMYNGFGTVP